VVAVYFTHDPPPDAAEHVEFFRAPVTFNAPLDALVVSSSCLNAVLSQADSVLASILERHIQMLLAIGPGRRLWRAAPPTC